MSKITKAVIPAAGFGTRFLPQTKAMPKEMMPLVDKPIIQRVVEELVEAGIQTIVIVTGYHKRAIEDHFDHQFELEKKLEASGKTDLLEGVRKISDLADFVYIRQKGVAGNATPILNAKHVLGSDPFLVFWGDDFIDATPSRARQLVSAYEKYQTMIIGGIRANSPDDYKKYGYVGGQEVEPGVVEVNKIIEKPGTPEAAPSDLGAISGFVFTPEIFEALEEVKKRLRAGEELVYTLGVQQAIDNGSRVHAIEIRNAIYHDTGNKLEYLKTVIEYGLKHPEISKDLRAYIKELKIREGSTGKKHRKVNPK